MSPGPNTCPSAATLRDISSVCHAGPIRRGKDQLELETLLEWSHSGPGCPPEPRQMGHVKRQSRVWRRCVVADLVMFAEMPCNPPLLPHHHNNNYSPLLCFTLPEINGKMIEVCLIEQVLMGIHTILQFADQKYISTILSLFKVSEHVLNVHSKSCSSFLNVTLQNRHYQKSHIHTFQTLKKDQKIVVTIASLYMLPIEL